MCLIITAVSAIISTLIWYFNEGSRKYKLGMLTLMYWGASLMWLVDSFFSIAEGGAFFELSVDDAVLGLVIVMCGLIVWIGYLLIKDPKNVLKLKSRANN